MTFLAIFEHLSLTGLIKYCNDFIVDYYTTGSIVYIFYKRFYLIRQFDTMKGNKALLHKVKFSTRSGIF